MSTVASPLVVGGIRQSGAPVRTQNGMSLTHFISEFGYTSIYSIFVQIWIFLSIILRKFFSVLKHMNMLVIFIYIYTYNNNVYYMCM